MSHKGTKPAESFECEIQISQCLEPNLPGILILRNMQRECRQKKQKDYQAKNPKS